jgi:transposase
MKLDRHDLQQLDEDALRRLPETALRTLSVTLLADLKEAYERLHQTPANSSRPPSSRAPWERDPPAGSAAASGADAATGAGSREGDAPPPDTPVPTGAAAASAGANQEPAAKKRHPGKQPGAPGVGRTQRFTAHTTEGHRPPVCAVCGEALAADAPTVCYTAFQALDLEWGHPAAPGLHLRIIDHEYHEVTCPCGHHTRARPAHGAVAATLEPVQVREWRLVGPGLASLIVALSLRFRMSRARIQEFLLLWLEIHLSIGTIHQTLHEAAAVVAPAQATLLADVQASGLLHADETPWPQHQQGLWLWVFVTTTTTLYVIAGRGKATVTRVLAGFTGWLMSDGWFSYRDYPHRLRCWAHLLRKAQGLVECCDPGGSAFGHRVRTTLEALMDAIYAARDGPPPAAGVPDLASAQAARLAALRRTCRAYEEYAHTPTRDLAVELLTDWDAIFRVLQHPHLPLTNNFAERALRHWVIARRLSHGTRTAVGSRAFALLASVIDTCRQRGHSPWDYLVAAITERRAGLPLPPLPVVGV